MNLNKKLKLSLVIPCFNEQGNIKYLFKSLLSLKNYKDLEIILVDNGSTDSTFKTMVFYKKKNKSLNTKLLKIRKNVGFGYGVYKGLKKSSGHYVCYTHADRETKIIDIKNVFKIILKNPNDDLFIKGKRVNRAKNHWTFLDEFFSRSCDIFLSLILLKPLIDIHAQPNAFSRKFLDKIKYFPKDFLIDAYFLYLAKKRNLKIIRFNVNFNKKKRLYGKGSSDNFLKKVKGGVEHIVGAILILIKSNT